MTERFFPPIPLPLAFLPVVLVVAGTARAEDEAAQLLPEVVVSASRTPVASATVGSAVTVITAEQLEQRQTLTVSDILRDVPGVSVGRSGPRGTTTQLRIRGAEARHTLVLIDGVEANSVADGSEFDFAHLTGADIERIEVLRGNQSALWGSDAIGGVVNIVTKRGSGAPRASAFAEGGSFVTRAGGASLRGGGERYDYALSGSGLTTGGTNVSRFGGEQDGYDNLTLNFKGHVRPTDESEIGLTLRGVRSKTEYDSGIAVPGAPLTDTLDEIRKRDTYGRVFGRLISFDGAWENQVGASLASTHNRNEVAGNQESENDGQRQKIDYLSTLRIATPGFADARHTATFLAEREREDFTQSATSFGSPRQERAWTNDALAGEYRVELWDALFLGGALRQDFNERFKDIRTGRATAAYLHAETGTRLHASYGTGSKNPSFISLYGFFANFAPNPNLSPETSKGWDAGVEQTFWGDRATIDITYFRQTVSNRISSVTVGGVTTPVNLPGDSRSSGVEISGRVTPLPGLDLRASYTYLEASDPSGLEQVRRAPHSGSFSANYRFLEERANLNLAFDYVGPTMDSDFTIFPSRRVQLDAYTLVTLAGSYRLTDNLELYGRVENLLDEAYEEVYGYRASGLGAYAGLRVTFGP